jgi:Protein of unknown function (DUF664)
MDPEAELLRDFLDQQRNHVLGILEDLTDEQLRRPVLPSGWHCLGMVKHHMIKETACHAGHLDAVRELIDGRQWIVM